MARDGPALHRNLTIWGKTWKVPVEIVGLYVLALTIAIAHLCFFNYLDGRFITNGVEAEIAEPSTSIPQAYVTTISFLLVTAFRAALVASVGTCYTQQLWATLREKPLKVSFIESLFQLRSSAFHFLNYHLALRAPTLTAVAAFCWLVPIATLYPPGTLTVGIGSSIVNTRLNVSTSHRPSMTDSTSSIARFSYLPSSPTTGGWIDTQALPPNYKDAQHWLNGFRAELPNSTDLGLIAHSVFMSGEVVNLDRPSRRDTTYHLNFRGTTVNCETSNQTIYRQFDRRDYYHAIHEKNMGIYDFLTLYNLTYIGDKVEGQDQILANRTIYYEGDITLRETIAAGNSSKLRYYPCYDLNGRGSRYLRNPEENNMYAPEINTIESKSTTICTPKIARYYVNITHAGGAQNVSYEIRDEGSNLDYNLRFESFDGDLEHWNQLSDAFTMYETFANMLSVSSSVFSLVNVSQIVTPLGPYELPNGTIVQTCNLHAVDNTLASNMRLGRVSSQVQLERSLWGSSVFGRHNSVDADYGIGFDPELMNDVLAKTTISALSLNQRFTLVDGLETRVLNVYDPQHKLSFILPYVLSLGLAIPIMVLGLFALYNRNHGVSAITGGFYQVLMTTTGRTSLETAIKKGSVSMGGSENVSAQLSNLEIRFGEFNEEKGTACTDARYATTHWESQDFDAEEFHRASADTRQEEAAHAMLAVGADTIEGKLNVRKRAGFGTADEVRPFTKVKK